jgi:hypothetical protein
MRDGHTSLPYHCIECWSGTYFRPGALWEVGLHLTVPHLTGMCQELEKHITDMLLLESDHDCCADSPTQCENHNAIDGTDAGTEGGSWLEEDPNQADGELGAAGQEIPEYSDSHPVWDDDLAGSVHGRGTVPTMDAFRNPFVRIIHVNGVHHLPLVTCLCRGSDHIPADLMYHGLVPTTFTQFRTLATSEVLDHIRHSNLDLKASTWQYHRLLRRQTQPLPVQGNINLYKELRRLSREWRWMKKLKWAGYGHGTFLGDGTTDISPEGETLPANYGTDGTAGRYADGTETGPNVALQNNVDSVQSMNPPVYLGDPLKPRAGSLANFCAACPQVGVNLCTDWENDPNQWVYTRFVVLDGNFKADHVRQKADDNDDIWLSNGGGIFANQVEYQEFIRTARQRHSVRCVCPRSGSLDYVPLTVGPECTM